MISGATRCSNSKQMHFGSLPTHLYDESSKEWVVEACSAVEGCITCKNIQESEPKLANLYL
jgi:hypothetical protein